MSTFQTRLAACNDIEPSKGNKINIVPHNHKSCLDNKIIVRFNIDPSHFVHEFLYINVNKNAIRCWQIYFTIEPNVLYYIFVIYNIQSFFIPAIQLKYRS